MVLICVERVKSVSPSIFKTFNRLVVVLLTHGNHQILVLDDTSIAKGDLASTRVDLIDTHIVRLSDVLADDLTSWGPEVKLGNTM